MVLRNRGVQGNNRPQGNDYASYNPFSLFTFEQTLPLFPDAISTFSVKLYFRIARRPPMTAGLLMVARRAGSKANRQWRVDREQRSAFTACQGLCRGPFGPIMLGELVAKRGNGCSQIVAPRHQGTCGHWKCKVAGVARGTALQFGLDALIKQARDVVQIPHYCFRLSPGPLKRVDRGEALAFLDGALFGLCGVGSLNSCLKMVLPGHLSLRDGTRPD
ncbi:hypothetical protein [Bradyrhizobium archetypum]|uniref:Uncharacterized protein n=1 Tax=Bradyrhizobium archetypum TaxID=2721160 RepID=A0A7Y4H9X5_9BRAD|nr:hypothetical protein [Bradyrhizobium archetypum]NOJ50365.1 hypothetical protein [Bradyrhizobium archetypum]